MTDPHAAVTAALDLPKASAPAAMSAEEAALLPNNWGRWGADDERGTLNFLSAESSARGARTVQSGRAVSLALPVTPVTLAGGGPVAAALTVMPAPVIQMISYDDLTQAYVDVLIVNSHNLAMTHIDVPVHCPVDDQIYPGVPRTEAVSGGRAHHATTSILKDGISTHGVLLDLAPGGRLEPGHSVGAEDFEEAERRQGVRVQTGDALVVAGGWTVHQSLSEPLPGLTVDAIRWIAEREVALYAGDIGDRPPGFVGDIIPLHYVALARLGMPIIDNAQVAELSEVCAELGRWEFLFTVGAMPILGATGVPVNPLAIF